MSIIAASSIFVCTAAIHALSWLAFPTGLQGSWLNISQLLLLCGCCYLIKVCAISKKPISREERKILYTAVFAVILDNIAVSFCSLGWILLQWDIAPGEEQCSKKYGVPLTLISCAIYSYMAASIDNFKKKE